MNYIDDMAGGLFTYDGTIFEVDWDAQQKVVENYLGTQNSKSNELYSSIHIDQSTKSPKFEMNS